MFNPTGVLWGRAIVGCHAVAVRHGAGFAPELAKDVRTPGLGVAPAIPAPQGRTAGPGVVAGDAWAAAGRQQVWQHQFGDVVAVGEQLLLNAWQGDRAARDQFRNLDQRGPSAHRADPVVAMQR
jgi:hypothetical protein